MDSLIVAKVLGVYLMVSAVLVITQKRTLAKFLQDLFAHRAITMVLGLLLLLGGTSLVLTGDSSTPFIITLLSWAILLKGVAYMFAPEWMHSLVKSWSMKSYSMLGFINLALGAYLYFFL